MDLQLKVTDNQMHCDIQDVIILAATSGAFPPIKIMKRVDTKMSRFPVTVIFVSKLKIIYEELSLY